ncbi:MAG: hypothetical protein ACRD1C_07985 [Terriglobales bacterium]
MARPQDYRPLHEQMSSMVTEWTMILGLVVLLVTWDLIALVAIGRGTRISPNYNLLRPTPAAQAYNTIHEFQRPRR